MKCSECDNGWMFYSYDEPDGSHICESKKCPICKGTGEVLTDADKHELELIKKSHEIDKEASEQIWAESRDHVADVRTKVDRDFRKEIEENRRVYTNEPDSIEDGEIDMEQWESDVCDEIDRLREKVKKLEEQNEKLRIDDHDYWWEKQMEIDRLRKDNERLKKKFQVEQKHRIREMKVRQKYKKFIDHIQNHLNDGEEVICKICGKTANEIMESD